MKIDEYLWRNKIKNREFGQLIGVSLTTIHKYKTQKNSPTLLHALKIVQETNGKVCLEDLLSKEDKKTYEEYLDTI